MSNGYQPQYPPPMHQQGYVQPPPRGASITAMVLGLVSIVLGFTFVVPIVGFVFGVIGYKKEPAGRGMAIAGLVLNGLMLLGWLVLLIVVFGIFGAALATVGTAA